MILKNKLVKNCILVIVVMLMIFSEVSYCFAGDKVSVPQFDAMDTCWNNAYLLSLTWDKLENVDGYQLYCAESKKGKYKKIAQTKHYYYGVDIKSPGKTYFFKVRAYKKAQNKYKYGDFSKIKSIKSLAYSDPEIIAQNAYKYLKKNIKFPSTLKLQSANYGSTSDGCCVYIEYTAKNEFNEDRRGYVEGRCASSSVTLRKNIGKTEYSLVNSMDMSYFCMGNLKYNRFIK